MSKPFDFQSIVTINGYKLAEVASALQKDIRRGHEEQALHWALEMADSGYSKYMFKRLKIIAAEDIGLINPRAFMLTKLAEDAYEQEKKATKGEADKHYIALAVLFLARSPKNREINDYLGTILYQRTNGELPEVPDYALDGHTARGKQMGRDKLKEWWNSGRIVLNAQGDNHYFERMYEYEGRQSIDGSGEDNWLDKEFARLEELHNAA